MFPALRPIARSLVPLAVAAVLVGAGCGGEDDVSRDTFRDDLEERTQIPAEVADCITDGVFDEFDAGQINDIHVAPSDAELRDDLGEDDFATLNGINEQCWTEAPETATTSEGDAEG